MSYEQDEQDRENAQQRGTDTDTYQSLKADAITLNNQVAAWHASAQTLATASTDNPGDTADLNTLRGQFQTQVNNVLSVPFV